MSLSVDEINRAAHRIITDSERLDWLQDHMTLHNNVEFLYVVDGWEATITYDSNPRQRYHGDTLRDAIDAAIAETPWPTK